MNGNTRERLIDYIEATEKLALVIQEMIPASISAGCRTESFDAVDTMLKAAQIARNSLALDETIM
jgi:hypothetical protein